ncbi:hypothetical protein BpOF4_04950 [Alkalihalophilus pseudofirmus OF4]|uniref:Uncharacterized protein n=1 Tax=Alkalihalophilus pseudofirmus (strain ATCC BAA-2126 / JCM 17055 / OF4) TaxID=398511 RepID=D3FZ21_ALKPO|nr:hypothetical protein [Alkalihalophilus pseudofirmus]ADC49054.1 hypothetical protein BpOF4_04950 [Alkalihalophilus pseudofirmus OF4]
MTMRSAFCFVWQSEATDYLNPAARHEKRRRVGWHTEILGAAI